ncbi:hypothetical protein ACSCB1_35310 [Streptomyces europaeiscabiei]|uniref:hypothetical protein n=1 Tax=Streptomyces europaeiscabiei TaxID=146819 RepID=UPI000ACD4A97|nr:hypothetical protein [Streptomyces europaeiscabiei]
MRRALTLKEQKAIQRAHVDILKRRKHAANTEWHFVGTPRALPDLAAFHQRDKELIGKLCVVGFALACWIITGGMISA